MAFFELFVYGTLKQGFGNHQRFCRGYRSLEPAVIKGRMYDVGFGFPMVEVPTGSQLAMGTQDPLIDTMRAEQLAAAPLMKPEACEAWDLVSGELMVFEDLRTRIPSLDRLEGFRCSDHDLYHRILLPVFLPEKGRTIPAWCYVAPKGKLERFTEKRRMTVWV